MRLALALGKFPGEIDAMPYADYVEFQAFYCVEPFGLPVQDRMNAHQISVAVNLQRDSKSRSEPYQINDFLLFPPVIEAVVGELVDGKSAEQWQLIFAAEAMQGAQQKNQST